MYGQLQPELGPHAVWVPASKTTARVGRQRQTAPVTVTRIGSPVWGRQR